MAKLRIAVDTGGTFTDFVVAGENSLYSFKLLSTPDDPSRAIIRGLGKIEARAIDFVHGSTVATNAVLEGKGARTALLTNAGFEDILFLGRGNRPKLYDLSAAKEVPLTVAGNCFGIKQRTAPDGREIKPLDLDSFSMPALKDFDAVAISLLHSYRNPDAESRLALALKNALPGIFCTVSSDLLREYREYERTASTFLNSYVGPKMQDYLDRLSQFFGHSNWFISGSGGGRLTYNEAKEFPVKTVLSGPAGGAGAVLEIGSRLNIKDLLCFDMGGTSTDVTLISNSRVTITKDSTIRDMPVAVPVIDIHTVGAGGGSIADIDAGGALLVGPKSAGASPGPACYDQGGLEPTVSDANLVLGRIPMGYKLADDLTPVFENALAAFGRKLNLEGPDYSEKELQAITELALGTVALANTHMENALRKISLERGYDTRQFVLVSFGGAGGLHSVELARALGIPQVIVPKLAATLSAYGMLCTDELHATSRTILVKAPTFEKLKQTITDVIQDYQKQLTKKGIILDKSSPKMIATGQSKNWQVELDVRYIGQSYEITIDFDNNFAESFHFSHKRMYGYRDDGRALEVVNVNLSYRRPVVAPAETDQKEKFQLFPEPFELVLPNGQKSTAKVFTSQSASFTDLGLGETTASPDTTTDKSFTGKIDGPALFLRPDTIIFVPDGAQASSDHEGNTIITTGVSS